VGPPCGLVAFAPSFAFVLVGAPHFERLRRNARMQAFLTGAGAAAIGPSPGITAARPCPLPSLAARVLGLAVAWLIGLRRGVVAALLGSGALGSWPPSPGTGRPLTPAPGRRCGPHACETPAYGGSGRPSPCRQARVKEGARLVLLNAPAGFELALPRASPSGPGWAAVLTWPSPSSRCDRASKLARLRSARWPTRPAGPGSRGRSDRRRPTDLTDDEVRTVLLPLGLVDNKVCAIDGTWSALRFVWRTERRTAALSPSLEVRRGGAAVTFVPSGGETCLLRWEPGAPRREYAPRRRIHVRARTPGSRPHRGWHRWLSLLDGGSRLGRRTGCVDRLGLGGSHHVGVARDHRWTMPPYDLR